MSLFAKRKRRDAAGDDVARWLEELERPQG